MATSTAEVEFKVMQTLTGEVIWLQFLLTNLGFNVQELATLFCDNIATQHIANNLIFHEHTKHINISYHFVKEKVKENKIQLAHIKGSEQTVDVLTKPLNAPRF
jgi:hypothetical protein